MSVFEQGVAVLQEGDYLKALQCFLRVREHKLDPGPRWDIPGGVRQLRLCDVDFNAVKEVGTVSGQGTFSVHSLLTGPLGIAPPADFLCHRFRFFRRETRSGETMAVVLAGQRRGINALPVYEFTKKGSGRTLTNVGFLHPGIETGQILDLAYKRGKIYVATSDRRLYQYNGVSLAFERKYELGVAIRELNTGGGRADRDDNSIMHHRLLGVSQEGGLVLMDIGAGGLSEQAVIGYDTWYGSTFVADADNDGIDDIIACAPNGKIHIYDWYSRLLKYEFACPDELYCMYCDDTDGDGHLEIFAGARSNHIYVLGVDPNGGLRVKWKYQTEHRALDLWVGNAQEDSDKRVVVALANGGLQVFRIHRTQEVNRGVAEAFRHLRENTGRTELSSVLAQADSPEVVCFALDELSRDLNCAEIVEFLKRVEEKGTYEVNLQVLSRLKPFLNTCVNALDLIEFVVGFLDRLFERHPDLPTCEQICILLDETIRDAPGAPVKLFELAERFRSELVRRKGSRPERASYAQELAKAGRLTEAGRELDILEVQGLDLLRSYKASEGVASLKSCSSGSTFLLTTFGGGADIVDDRLQESSLSLRYKEPGLYGCPIPEPPYGCIIGHGTTIDVYDCNRQRIGGGSYDQPIRCIEALVFGGGIFWLVGLDDGTIVLDGLGLRNVPFSVPACPVKLMRYEHDNRTDVYVITLDGRLYRLQDLGAVVRQAGQAQRSPVTLPLVASIPGSPNVVDAFPVAGPPESRGFLVLSPTSLYFLQQSNGGFANKKIVQDKALSCLGLYSPSVDQAPEAIVGTHLRGLLFVSLQGQTLREVFLSDVPTAIQATKGDRHGPKILVGFARGDLNLYQLVGPDFLDELKRLCQLEGQYRRGWTEHNLQEKLALIALARSKELDRDGLLGSLNRPLELLMPEERLLPAIKRLEQSEFIRGQVRASKVFYAFKDTGYADWVRRQNLLETVRTHREEIVGTIKLSDVAAIDRVLTERNEQKWLFDFLQIEPRKWASLVRVSELLEQGKEATIEHGKSLRRQYVEFLSANIGAILKRAIQIDDDLASLLSAFEIQVPAVKFHGFDRILAVTLSYQEGADLARAMTWVKKCSDWRIVLVLTAREKQTIRNLTRDASSSVAVLDHDDLKDMLLAGSPRERFLDLLIDQINIAALSPFRVRGPVQEMFYGRELERRKIMNSLSRADSTSFAIVGPRRIGKSSLLKRIKQEVEQKEGFKAIYLDSSPWRDDIGAWYGQILRELGIQEESRELEHFVSAIDAYCRDHRLRLVLLLDEVDNLLSADERHEHVFFSTLRALINQAGVKVLVAGYRTLFHQLFSYSSPLFNMVEPIVLSALDRREAFALVEEPLRHIFTIEHADIDCILDKTACHPNYIQFFCSSLVKRAHAQGRRTITRSDIVQVADSQDLYDFMVDVFLRNLDEKAKTLVYLMVAYYDRRVGRIVVDRKAHESATTSTYAGARRKSEIGATFTPYDLHRLLELHGVTLTHQQVEDLTRDLVMASVLRREEGQREYSFVLSDLPAIMNRHLEVELVTVDLLERVATIFGKEK